ncbi:hypothetical protein SLEP1_g48006 [Rubroshorea leprosula]|uniref:Integrase catalytic domain-containing protein n=1 Tax=Rubroshorea leprosula TaxID=152421 RepID=A0AAV5LTB1_9ROSI|nr:hypothetical protein SLEP1_g48006 [Rubroshorea leprosula]
MCIDYTNLNQVCPKDCYPMPSIDKLVEVTSRNERLSLLDAYSGYHKVPMAPENEEKTSFYASDEIYYYIMMPFGLKNAGATYQKMVTIVFRSQIGRNLEVYVDDIVVKSLKAENHLANLDETFNNLKKNRMRLNPTKCIFDVESRKFLGFMVSRRGIEIMRSAAQKDGSGKQKKFKWNQECQATFDELKSYLSSPPLLTKAMDGEILYLYLDISNEAISSVLVREEGKQQKPIYYINNVLHIAELRYPIAEKAILAVVTSARKLRPYFQLHLVIQRSAIRAQALVDFIVECTPCHLNSNPELSNWILYVDGASNSKGSGAGAFLVGADGYRTLELQVVAIRVYSDFQFVVNQVNSICEVIDLVMAKSVFVEILDEPSFMKPRMMEISTDPKTPSWIDPIISFLQDRIVLEDKQEAMSYIGARTLAHKVLKHGYYWPNMYKDATHFVQRCPKCQFSAHLTHQPTEGLTNLVASWPFAQWGLDLLGPFMKGVGGVTHLIVGVDYFTKWVEVWPLSSLTSTKVEDFVFGSIICRYGIPNQIVADNGETPYHLTFGTESVISIEIGLSSFRVTHFDEGRNGQLFRENLDLLAKVREEARLRTLVYKQKLANFYNKRVRPRTFKVGNLVLGKACLSGFETHFGKLAPIWEGPYTVAEVPHPGAYILQDVEGKRVLRVWNINNLKKFYP